MPAYAGGSPPAVDAQFLQLGQKMKIRLKFLIAIICISSIMHSSYAGGTSFTAEILEFIDKGNSEYKMVMLQYEKPYEPSQVIKPNKITIHLRHDPLKFGNSRKEYLECIKILQKQLTKGGKFKFGIIGPGYNPIEGENKEYQSNTLTVKEIYTGEKIVFSSR